MIFQLQYCYRHFPSKYGLVVWLNAETVDTLITDYRQLLADLAPNNNLDSDMEKSSTEEIIREVRTRLFRSNVPWLLIYDNLEDHSILERFVPRGAGTNGHVLVTTRQVDAQSGIDSNAVLSLGCLDTSEAIELLVRSAGEHNMEGASNANAAKELCEKLGSLPLALSIAAAYMRQCDVQCLEYVARYNSSEKEGQSLIQHGNSVASSLSLILPKIQEKNQTTSEVLHLLSFLGSDGVTKMLLRYLLNAKKNIDQKIAEGKLKARAKKQAVLVSSLSFCLVVGGAALIVPATSRHRAITLAMLSATATSLFVVSRSFASEPNVNSFPKKRESRLSLTFSAFEYEESDISWDILKSFSLLSVKEGKASIHRLLQQAMRSCQSQEDSIYYMTICIDAMVSYWSFSPDAIETWKPSLLLLEHVKSVVSYAQEYGFSERETLRLSTLSKEAGVLSAMALNAFVEAQSSLELSLKLLEKKPTLAKTKEFRSARASTLHELSKIHRYQGRYTDAHQCLMDSLGLLNKSDDSLRADIYHELGILEVKQHKLVEATSYLERSLDIRRGLDDTDSDQINASSTLHQLAAINVARKPPSLDKAKSLLEEALRCSRQIGQRAATIKQLARVTIRQGYLDQAEALLEQALQLYLELYDNNKLHINVAAVKFQQGALALQRERVEDAKRHFIDCLLIRRHVYAYASGPCNANPTHLEVACVLHEIGRVEFSNTRFSQSMDMFKDEKIILERLMEASTNDGVRIYQARLNNLTWLRKCAKEMGDDDMATVFANERTDLKKQTDEQSKQAQQKLLYCESVSLQRKVVQSRLLARRFALEKKNSSQSCRGELVTIMDELSNQLKIASSGPMKQAAMEFRDTLLPWIDRSNNRAPILTACDHLR